MRLSTVPVEQTATILLISEVVEDEEALIMYMHEKGLTPGIQVQVIDQGSFNVETQTENVLLDVNHHQVSISKPSAAKIWVTL